MTLIIGLPGRTGAELTDMEKRTLRVRTRARGGFETVSLSSIPATSREVTQFVDEMKTKNCRAILLKNRPGVPLEVPEHIFGPILLTGVHVLHFPGQLEILSSFSDKRGVFTFCGPNQDEVLFSKAQASV